MFGLTDSRRERVVDADAGSDVADVAAETSGDAPAEPVAVAAEAPADAPQGATEGEA